MAIGADPEADAMRGRRQPGHARPDDCEFKNRRVQLFIAIQNRIFYEKMPNNRTSVAAVAHDMQSHANSRNLMANSAGDCTP
jgi:hypothetical protein